MLSYTKLAGCALTFASFIFLIILIIVYAKKDKQKSTRQLLFKVIIICTFLLCFLQVCHSLLFAYTDFKYMYLFWRIHWFFAAAWWFVYAYYVYCLTNKVEFGSVKDLILSSTRNKVLFVLFLLMLLFVLLMPNSDFMDHYDVGGMISYFYEGGFLRFACYIISFGSLFTMFINIIISRNKNKEERVDWFVFISLSIVNILCIIFSNLFEYVSILGFGYVLGTYVAYFINENPEIYLLKEIEKSQKKLTNLNVNNSNFLNNLNSDIKVSAHEIDKICDNVLAINEYNKEEINTKLDEIIKNSNNILDGTSSVFDNSMLEIKGDAEKENNYNIRSVIDEVLTTLNEKKKENINIITDIDSNVPSVLKGDPTKLTEGLVNIVRYSLDSTEVGKISFKLSFTKDSNGVNLTFVIKDTGKGLTDNEKTHIFDDKSNLLFISNEYLKSIGATFTFDSYYGVGSTYMVNINEQVVDNTPISNEKKYDNTGDITIDGTGKKILIVDNDDFTYELISSLLKKYHFDIEYLNDGKKCIFNIKNEEHYDLILIDYLDKDYDSANLVRIIKALKDYHIPPVVAMSNNALTGSKEEFINMGFDEFLAKPINDKDLERIIIKCFM